MSLQFQSDEQDEQMTDEGDNRANVPSIVPYYTYILIASIIAVVLVQFGTGLNESILAAGFDKPLFLQSHEYWRIFTGATVHGGIAHVLMNCYAFYSFGRIFEMLSNRAHLAIVFLLSALGGGILSLIFVPGGISVGASGGVVGLIGYLAVYSFQRRRFITPEFRKNLLINIGFILVFGIVLYQTIDNFGHVGGLLTGAVYGLLQIPTDEHVDPREAGASVEFIGIGAVMIYLVACTYSILLILKVV